MTELLITSSVLITAIVLVRAALKNRVSARLIYALWLVAPCVSCSRSSSIPAR